MHPSVVLLLQRAGAQLGLIRSCDARELGISASMLRDLRREAVLERLNPNVDRVVAAPRTWEQRALAAVWSCGSSAVLSHLAAAFLSGLAGFRAPGWIDVTVSRDEHPRRRKGVRIHQSKAFELMSPTVRHGVPVTGVAATILGVCAMSGRDETDPLRALDDARRRGIVSWIELWECLATHACRGRNGIVLYRQILLKRWGARHPGGDFARLVEKLFASVGLAAPVFEHMVRLRGRTYYIDLAYPDLKIAIELIGKEGHDHEGAFENDPIRRNALLLDGWLVIEFTWTRFVEDPAGMVQEIRDAIALRSGAR